MNPEPTPNQDLARLETNFQESVSRIEIAINRGLPQDRALDVVASLKGVRVELMQNFLPDDIPGLCRPLLTIFVAKDGRPTEEIAFKLQGKGRASVFCCEQLVLYGQEFPAAQTDRVQGLQHSLKALKVIEDALSAHLKTGSTFGNLSMSAELQECVALRRGEMNKKAKTLPLADLHRVMATIV